MRLPSYCAEKRIRQQYFLQSQKYIEHFVSDELVNIDGVLDLIGALENKLATLVTPLIDTTLAFVKKATRLFTKKQQPRRHFLIDFDALATSLEKIDVEEALTGKSKSLVKPTRNLARRQNGRRQ